MIPTIMEFSSVLQIGGNRLWLEKGGGKGGALGKDKAVDLS
jgi:hypothetical protein